MTRRENVRALQSHMVTPIANLLVVLAGLLVAAGALWVYKELWVVRAAYENELCCRALWCPSVYDPAEGLVFPTAAGPGDLCPIRAENYDFHRSVVNLLSNANINQAAARAPPGTKVVLRVDRPGRPCMAFGVLAGRGMAVALRGLTDLRDDFDFEQVEVAEGEWVHEGYQLDYEDVSPEILRVVDRERPETLVLVGHSLGGALSVLLARGAKALLPESTVVAVTYGTPRVGNERFSETLRGVSHVRIENEADAVPALPPSVCPNWKRPASPFMYCPSGAAHRFHLNWLSLSKNHSLACYRSWVYSLPGAAPRYVARE